MKWELEDDTYGVCMTSNQEWRNEFLVEITLEKIDSDVIYVY